MLSLLKSYAISALFGGAGFYINSWESEQARAAMLVAMILIGLVVTTWRHRCIRRDYAKQLERRLSPRQAQGLAPHEPPDLQTSNATH
jgi:heme exporter protein D